MNKLSCIPVYLYPVQRLGFSSCSIVPGIKVVRLKGQLLEIIKTSSENLPIKLEFAPTHAICIEEELYLKALESRLQLEGQELPTHIFMEGESHAKHAVLSLLLAGRVSFAFRGIHSFQATGNAKRAYRANSYSDGPLYKMSELMSAALLNHTGTWPPINPSRVRKIGEKLDRYYRSGMWWSDRLAMALSYIWDALCTPFSTQSYLSLTTALEALLSTQSMEITHNLAERSAVLVSKDPLQRLATYRRVKDLYKIRSKIVHGKVFPKKGVVTYDSLFISAKRSYVPISALGTLAELTVSIIMSILTNTELLGIIQTKKSEDRISDAIDDFFIRSLFNA